MKRIHEGAIGDLLTARVYWNQSDIWAHPRQSGWNDTEYQIRNWYHFLWLCGDHIVEQHVHNLDVAIWASARIRSRPSAWAAARSTTSPSAARATTTSRSTTSSQAASTS